MIEQNLSILSLVINASLLVQCVMGILFLSSLISWIMIVQRWLYLSTASRNFRVFEETFWSGIDLTTLYSELSENFRDGKTSGIEIYSEPALVSLVVWFVLKVPMQILLWKVRTERCA